MTSETQEIVIAEEPIKISDLKHPDEVFGIRGEHNTYILPINPLQHGMKATNDIITNLWIMNMKNDVS